MHRIGKCARLICNPSYTLVTLGSTSRIEKHPPDKAVYELYGSDEFIVRFLHNLRFDSAMVGFVDCLRQIIEFAKLQDPKLDIPHQ